MSEYKRPGSVVDLTGQRFGFLTALRISDQPREARRGVKTLWDFRCDCGAIVTRLKPRSTWVASCGCRGGRPAPSRKHGLTKSKTWNAWRSMRKRCNDPDDASYARYGGRGISICSDWSSFEHFLADMGEAPMGRSLDRIDNDGNYEPGNCRWATITQQNRNTSTNRRLTHNGETRTVTEWAVRLGMTKATLFHRLDQGWSAERALTEPVHPNGRTR